jgi:hypothetical protein
MGPVSTSSALSLNPSAATGPVQFGDVSTGGAIGGTWKSVTLWIVLGGLALAAFFIWRRK